MSFIQQDLDRCPNCGSDNIDVMPDDEITRVIVVVCTCEACGERWVDIYEYSKSTY